MDTPILALTRKAREARAGASSAMAAGDNMRLLVQLRWMAVAGQLATILFVHYGMGIDLPLAPMLGIVLALAAANPVVSWIARRRGVTSFAIFLALLFDMVALSLQLYLSGGADNPFISLFFLQVVLAAILLRPLGSGALAVCAAGAFATLIVFRVPYAYPPGLASHGSTLQLIAAWLSFFLTVGLLAVFISRISRNLRLRELYLAELQRAAAEEEGIVRMGLLASGAAHELGTPLAAISVVLSDWARMPRVLQDAELSGELKEMQREIGRAKAILGDVLHSVGVPSGDDRDRAVAGLFLENLARDWRYVHPATDLVFRAEDLGSAVIIDDPAVRNTVVSLLDNAAEVSPRQITLRGRIIGAFLEVAVLDQGPGFTETQLTRIGRPLQSTKGAGRGLGLFLAQALARRLGGRLRARNIKGGGAEVTLTIPLFSEPVTRPLG